MPLGNLTSQFFANVYLNELDYFVKHKLKVKYYIRYVDDFVILHNSNSQLNIWKQNIDEFLKENLKLELHSDKPKIIKLKEGIPFLGFNLFYHHKLLKNSNVRQIKRNLVQWDDLYSQNKITIKKIIENLQGWIAYAKHGNTYNLRNEIINYSS